MRRLAGTIAFFLVSSRATFAEEQDEVAEQLTMVQKWVESGQEWLVENGPTWAVKILLFLVVLFVFKLLAALLGKAVRKGLDRPAVRAPDLLKTFFVNVTAKSVFLVGLLLALSIIKVPVGPLLAGVGVLGFVIGFALQESLSNFAAGIMILLYRPYDVGDVITGAGVTGKVASMSLVSTALLSPDNQTHIVPNGKIWGGVITNITANSTRRVDLVVGVGYDADLEITAKLLREVAERHVLVLDAPEVTVAVDNLGESSVDFVVRPWCKTADYWTLKWELTQAIKLRLDQEGISIPYPQRDIHLVTGALPAAAQ